MQKNVLHLQKKYRNVVDLHGKYVVPHSMENVVDLRSPVVPETHFKEKIEALHGDEQKTKPYTLGRNYFSFLYKTLSVFLFVLINSVALSSIGATFSIFNDIETSSNNIYIAGVIDFTLDLSPFSNNAWQNLVSGTSTAQDIDVLPNIASNPFFYFASSTNFTGDQTFCNAINVVATTNGDVQYDGPLVDLLSPTTTNIAIWNLEFSNDQKFFNSVCQFDIDFNGWQTRHNYPNYHDGYSDTEKTTHVLYSDGLKINKVYFEDTESVCRMDMTDHVSDIEDETTDRRERGERQEGRESWPHPDRDCYDDRGRLDSNTNTTQNAPLFEWVELYNGNNDPVDIDGWFLCDGQACDTLNASEPIPPGGFAIVVGDYGHLDGWITPSDFVIIVVDDGVIGDGLDNENDALFLRRPDFFTFDQTNWGIPEMTWPYFVPTLWNPGVASTTEGTMIARVPTGFDTNQVTDFKILNIPTIDLLYPGSIVTEPWYWGFTYLVTWDAFNPNGDASDLLIDIYMIRDTNYNDEIDETDEVIQLASKTENDGNEEITVPEGFVGNIWIKIVATGPENPMAHGFEISGAIYNSIPSFMIEDEDKQEPILEALFRQMLATGESEFSHLLPQPDVATSSASSTTETILKDENLLIDGEQGTTSSALHATTTKQVASSTPEIATSTEPVASTTPQIIEIADEEENATSTSSEQESSGQAHSTSSGQASSTEAVTTDEEEVIEESDE